MKQILSIYPGHTNEIISINQFLSIFAVYKNEKYGDLATNLYSTFCISQHLHFLSDIDLLVVEMFVIK